jgi:hypothetical protein
MLAAVGSNETFEALPTASKIRFLLRWQVVRAKLSVFDDYQLLKERRGRDRKRFQSGLRIALESIGERWSDNAVRVVLDLGKHMGTHEKARRAMRRYIDFTRGLLAINESAETKSPQSEPQTRSLKQDAETEMLHDLLDEVSVPVVESGSDAYDSKGLVLMGLMTSGNVTLPEAMRKRLATLRNRVGKFSGNLA